MKNINSITNKTPLQDSSPFDMVLISSRNKNYICPYLANMLKVKIISRVNDSSCLYEVTKATAKRS
jgi:hypothetical protein